jgi:hypothetical protein
MKHQTVERTRQVATVQSIRPMRPSQRLEHWANLLDRYVGPPLRPLRGTEYEPVNRRDAVCEYNSPLSVAYADPLLRAEGLEGDTYGHARAFFKLSDAALHELVCHCHYGPGSVSASEVASRVRRAARSAHRAERRDELLTRVCARGRSALRRLFA